MEVQVHRKKGRVVGHVHVAKTVVELDAVADVQGARRDMDVIEMQIAVAVPDAMLFSPGIEQPMMPGQSRRLRVTSRSQKCRRLSKVEKLRKLKFTGFFTLSTKGGAMQTKEAWVRTRRTVRG